VPVAMMIFIMALDGTAEHDLIILMMTTHPRPGW
jgi:hypothetical protein